MGGIIDWLFGEGSDKEEKAKQSGTSTTDTSQAKEEVSASSTQTGTTSSSSQQGTQVSTGTALSGTNQSILDQLIAGAAVKSNVYGDTTKQALQDQLDLGSTVKSLAGGMTPLNIDNIVKSAQDSAKLAYNEGEGAQISQFADQTGSKLNSTVQLLQQKGQRDLATTLAAVEGDIRLKGAETQNETIKTISDVLNQVTGASGGIDVGSSQALQDALSALGVAKGTQTTASTQAAQSQVAAADTTENKVSQDILQQVLEQITKSTGTTSGSSSGGGTGNLLGLLDILTRF